MDREPIFNTAQLVRTLYLARLCLREANALDMRPVGDGPTVGQLINAALHGDPVRPPAAV